MLLTEKALAARCPEAKLLAAAEAAITILMTTVMAQEAAMFRVKQATQHPPTQLHEKEYLGHRPPGRMKAHTLSGSRMAVMRAPPLAKARKDWQHEIFNSARSDNNR